MDGKQPIPQFQFTRPLYSGRTKSWPKNVLQDIYMSVEEIQRDLSLLFPLIEKFSFLQCKLYLKFPFAKVVKHVYR